MSCSPIVSSSAVKSHCLLSTSTTYQNLSQWSKFYPHPRFKVEHVMMTHELADSSTSMDHQTIRQHLENKMQPLVIPLVNRPGEVSPSFSQSSGTVMDRIAKKRPIPDEEKDAIYWEKRRRNNEAAKRSREKRRQCEVENERRMLQLSKENCLLKNSLTVPSPHVGDPTDLKTVPPTTVFNNKLTAPVDLVTAVKAAAIPPVSANINAYIGVPSAFAPPKSDLKVPPQQQTPSFLHDLHTLAGLNPLLSLLPQQAALMRQISLQHQSPAPQDMGLGGLLGFAGNPLLNRQLYQNFLAQTRESPAPVKQISPDSTAAVDLSKYSAESGQSGQNPAANIMQDMLPKTSMQSPSALLSNFLAQTNGHMRHSPTITMHEADSSLGQLHLPTRPAFDSAHAFNLPLCIKSESLNHSSDQSQISPSSSIGTIESHEMHESRQNHWIDRENMTEHEKYQERRRRNNEAAKKCRANRRKIYEERLDRAQSLENENSRLRLDVERLRRELHSIKQLIQAKNKPMIGNEKLLNIVDSGEMLDLRMEICRERSNSGHRTDLSTFSGSPSSTLSQRTSGDNLSNPDSGNENRISRESSPLNVDK